MNPTNLVKSFVTQNINSTVNAVLPSDVTLITIGVSGFIGSALAGLPGIALGVMVGIVISPTVNCAGNAISAGAGDVFTAIKSLANKTLKSIDNVIKRVINTISYVAETFEEWQTQLLMLSTKIKHTVTEKYEEILSFPSSIANNVHKAFNGKSTVNTKLQTNPFLPNYYIGEDDHTEVPPQDKPIASKKLQTNPFLSNYYIGEEDKTEIPPQDKPIAAKKYQSNPFLPNYYNEADNIIPAPMTPAINLLKHIQENYVGNSEPDQALAENDLHDDWVSIEEDEISEDDISDDGVSDDEDEDDDVFYDAPEFEEYDPKLNPFSENK